MREVLTHVQVHVEDTFSSDLYNVYPTARPDLSPSLVMCLLVDSKAVYITKAQAKQFFHLVECHTPEKGPT